MHLEAFRGPCQSRAQTVYSVRRVVGPKRGVCTRPDLADRLPPVPPPVMQAPQPPDDSLHEDEHQPGGKDDQIHGLVQAAGWRVGQL